MFNYTRKRKELNNDDNQPSEPSETLTFHACHSTSAKEAFKAQKSILHICRARNSALYSALLMTTSAFSKCKGKLSFVQLRTWHWRKLCVKRRMERGKFNGPGSERHDESRIELEVVVLR